MCKYKAVLFDLGNVVIRFSFDKTFNIWARLLNLPAVEVEERFRYDEAFALFEKGLISDSEYIRHVCSLMGGGMTEEIFLEGWNSIFTGAVPGITGILKELKPKIRLAALTNTNKIHSLYWKREYSEAVASFERIFESHEIGYRKPEPESFRHVLKEMNLSPDEVLFLDDLEENTEAAEREGIRGVTVSVPGDAVSALTGLGLLSSSRRNGNPG